MLQLLLVEYHARIGTRSSLIVIQELLVTILTLTLITITVVTQTESHVHGATQPIPVHDGTIVMFNIVMESVMVLIPILVDVIQSVNVITVG